MMMIIIIIIIKLRRRWGGAQCREQGGESETSARTGGWGWVQGRGWEWGGEVGLETETKSESATVQKPFASPQIAALPGYTGDTACGPIGRRLMV